MTTDTKTSVRLTIDDTSVKAASGETVLSAARRAGIDIPALCHEEGMAAWGACRLCLIEVEGLDKLQAACTTQVADGLVVRTNTARTRAKRASYLRMYLSDHNSYCEAPCKDACPAHIDIPAYIKQIEDGDFAAAAATVRKEMPFPGILGRICPRYCEPVCRRGEVDEPIAICALHRAAGDHAPAALVSAHPSGHRVAVIGAGPAGLSCAWYLTAAGHEVTIYDKAEKPGGMLRYTIPEFRLPESDLDAELQPLWDAGVRFVENVALGVDINPYGLLQAGFDAVFVGVGAWQTMPSRIPGHEAMLDALRLLRDVGEGKKPALSGTVVVLGDGAVAFDAARVAVRQGAQSVVLVSRHAADDVEAGQRELAAARAEGVQIEALTEAKRVKLRKGGKPTALECVRLEADASGKLVEAKGSRFELKADVVISALSFATVVDDRDMGITHVIRGDDHLTNTARQQLLFIALGGPVPSWAHHSMVLAPDGGKLSKRHGATSVAEFRDLGYLPAAIVNYLALLGWSHGEEEVLDLDRLVREFDLDGLSASPAVFDAAKLDWLDHERIMALAPDEHRRRFAERLPADTPPQAAAALAAAAQPSLVRYGDAPALAAEVLAPPPPPDALRACALAAAAQLAHVRALRAAAPEWLTPAAARDLLAAYRAWGTARGCTARELLMPWRIALTSAEHGPELPFVLAALDRSSVLARLDLILTGPGESTPTPGDPS